MGGVRLLYGVCGGLRILGVAEGISGVGANRALVYQYLVTLVGVASGAALLGASLTIDKIAGGAIILFGVYLARR